MCVKIQTFLGVAILLFVGQLFAANGFMAGDGSSENPFQIEDYEDLKAIGKGVYLYSSNYVLTGDIDASASMDEMCNEDGCNGFVPIGMNKDATASTIFGGAINGDNHTISNLTIWFPCEANVAFISYFGGSVANLNFDHIRVTGRTTGFDHVAGVAAKQTGSIRNVHITNGFVLGRSYVGGIAGEVVSPSGGQAVLEDVSFQGEIKGLWGVGGIAGKSDVAINHASADVNIIVMEKGAGGIVGFGDAYLSQSHGTITPTEAGVDEVGGISGNGTVYSCFSTMDLIRSSGVSFDEKIGGIVGKGDAYFSYIHGTVEGTDYVGGLVGMGKVENSYAIGTVRGSKYVGGAVGSGSVRYSYAASVVQGDEAVGGLVGSVSGNNAVVSSYWNVEISGLDASAGGVGLSTAEMMSFTSFVDWSTLGYDEYHYWAIDEGRSFPYLDINPFSKKSQVPIAIPTAAAKWQENPLVASLVDVDGELIGKWLGWAQRNNSGDSGDSDSLYYGYRIGAVNGRDTVWGTSSYMAVPNKIEISSFAQLQKIGNHVAYPLEANYELTADIDGLGQNFEPIGDSVHAFVGVFDGKKHTIRNLQIGNEKRDFSGFFGYAQNAVIQNLKLMNVKVTGCWFVGAMAGSTKNSVVTNVISLNGDVEGESFVGGLIGEAVGGNIAIVATTGNIKGDDYIGGVVGDLSASINDAFSINVIKGYEYVGGVFGYVESYAPIVRRVYSASMIKAPDGRGLAASALYGALDPSSCFFDGTVAQVESGGLPTASMLKQETYSTYDFDAVWEIQEDVSYPYFKGMGQMEPGKLDDDGTVNFLAGKGTERNPYQIHNYEELKYVGKYEYTLDKYYKLMGNIDASLSKRENCNADGSICKGFEPIGEFSGVFIGDNKIIAGLNINRSDEDSVGLFRALAKNARVTGIVFDTTSYFGEDYTHGDSSDKGFVRGKNYVGTLAGVDNGAVVENIFVKNDVMGDNYVGSVVGKKTSGTIERSASRFLVSGKEYVGGLVGYLDDAVVSDCYSIANVVGERNVGGLVGNSDHATVRTSFAAGKVQGNSKWGGLVGSDKGSDYVLAYYDSSLWFVNVTAAGELRNTRQMVSKENYEGWDIENTWKIVADTTYPYLSWLGRAYPISQTMKEKVYPNLTVDSTMLKMKGSGTEDDPFLIKTYGDLKSIGYGKYKLSSIYRVVNDIDASVSKTEARFSGRGTGFKPIGKIDIYEEYCDCSGVVLGGYTSQDTSRLFSGKLYGGGHRINGLFMNYMDNEPKGFIDTIATTGMVDSLSFKKYEFSTGESGLQHVGALASVNMGSISYVDVDALLSNIYHGAGLVYDNKGRIESCAVKGAFKGGSIAGIAEINDGVIIDVNVDAEWMEGSWQLAGIALVNRGLVKRASAKVKANDATGPIGGIAALNTVEGQIDSATVSIDVKAKSREAGNVSHSVNGSESEIFGFDGVGGIVATDSGNISSSTVTGTIEAQTSAYVGGAIGKAYGKNMRGLHASVNVVGKEYVGGLVGLNKTAISECFATGNVQASEVSSGGFVGWNDGLIERSFAKGDVHGGAGFVGVNNGSVKQSYSVGDVTGSSAFVGVNQSVIEDCYSTGDVYLINGANALINTPIARFRGYVAGNVVRNEINYCGGMASLSQPVDEFYYLADNCVDSLEIGSGLTPDEMRTRMSFDKFNFDSVWFIKEGVTYPLLRGMPNPPVVSNIELTFGEGEFQVKKVYSKLLEEAIEMDMTAVKVLKMDPVDEFLLDSLEKTKTLSGKFQLLYHVGVLLGSDTLWGAPAVVDLNIERLTTENADVERSPGIYEFESVSGLGFGALFKGSLLVLRYDMPAAGTIRFTLVDMQGREVRSLDLGHRIVGAYRETLVVDGIADGPYIGVLLLNDRVVRSGVLLKK